MLLDGLYKLKVFNHHPSDFLPYHLRVFGVTTPSLWGLSEYFARFIRDPERSREFCYEGGLWHTFVATRYLRYLRTLSNLK